MQITSLSPALGVEVTAVDVTSRLGDDEIASLRAALDEHHLILVRGQDLDEAAQESFTGLFGPVIDPMGNGRRSGYISTTHAEGHERDLHELLFHSDWAFTPGLMLGASLYAIEVPPDGTSTRFANAQLAWERLPGDLKDRARHRLATHVYADGYVVRGDIPARRAGLARSVVRGTQPLVMSHPRTGQEILYCGEMSVERVEGMSEAKSRELLDALCEHVASSAHVYEHEWTSGDIIVWDNLPVVHARGRVSTPRTLRRVSLSEHRLVDIMPA
jgi:taurine dioxygenase